MKKNLFVADCLWYNRIVNAKEVLIDMAVNRQGRVARLKKIIVFLLLMVILLPTILCIYLVIRMNHLEQEIQKLYQTRIEIIEGEGKVAAGEPAQAYGQTESVSAPIKEISVPMTEALSAPAERVSALEGTEEAEPSEKEEADERKKVYLTFDDGPSRYTKEILDILDQYGVKATFFVVGKEEWNLRPFYSEIADRGHTLGMHSYSHRYSEIYQSVESFEEDLHKISDLIYEETGEYPKYYRFPGGSSNHVSHLDMQEFVSCLNGEEITYFDWNVAASDADGRNLSVKEILGNVKKDSQKYEATVVLLHDTGSRETTVEALPEIIEYYQSIGVDLRPIDENTPLVQHRKAEQGPAAGLKTED